MLATACLALAGIAASEFPASAASTAWVKGTHVEARLLAAVGGTGDLQTILAGVELKLDGNWKTYWRAPGEAGLPPALDWAGSANLAHADLLYPQPERLTLLGIQTFGYKHDVVFPIDLAVSAKGQPLDLKLKLDILVCAELCIPQTFNLSLALPAGAATPDAVEAQRLAQARASVPSDSRTTGLEVTRAEEVSDKGKPALEVEARSAEPFASPDVIAELGDIAFGAPRVGVSTDRHAATFVLPLLHKLPVGTKLTGRTTTLTLLDGARASEQTRPITQGATAIEEEPGPSLLAMFGVALLGGLILNLMPCVLPVLSLKLVSVVGQGGRAPAAVRAGFLATAAGILVSFLAIAAVLIAAKAGGRTIGWGLQFQEPGFIAGMAVLVTVFACHLAGLFEVPLPRVVARAAESRTGPDESLAGHFVTGAFATLLATPCSAPFLGTAVGFALAGNPATMLGIFAALGLGLALPYLLVALVPSLAARLPRPGRWMLILKQVLALPLAGTAVWLLVVLAAQSGMPVAIAVGVLLGGLVALLVWQGRQTAAPRQLAMPAAVIVGIAAIAVPYVAATQMGRRGAIDDGIAWTSFDRGQIRSLVSQGRTVFVDVTADWCLTCQANRRFVLSQDAIARRLNGQAVSMQADWTRPDPAIGAYLASYGRYGIPFNIVYGPSAPGGIVLPELLTGADVEAALDRASSARAEIVPTGKLATATDR